MIFYDEVAVVRARAPMNRSSGMKMETSEFHEIEAIGVSTGICEEHLLLTADKGKV
jgi:hypothetical protein